MRIFRAFRLGAALAWAAAAPARAAAPVVKAAPVPSVSLACPLILSGPSPITPALSIAPASLTPSLLPALRRAPAERPPAVRALASAPALRGALPIGGAPAIGDAPGPEAEHYAKFFDGVKAPEEGAIVRPRVVAPVPGGPTLRQPMHLTVVQHAVRRATAALRESVALGGWNGPHTTLDESCCGDAAPKLAVLLRAQGLPARLVEAEFHYYVILDLPDGQIIVDPTVRQFFGKKQAPRSVPLVFVGTVAELSSLFHRHPASKTTRYDASRIYFTDAVVRENALRAYEEKVRAGGAADLEPLRRFLGLPAASGPAAS